MNLIRLAVVLAVAGLPVVANAQDISDIPQTTSSHPFQVQSTTVPAGLDAVPAGTQIFARMDHTVGTGSRQNEGRFSATVEAAVRDANGHDLVPVGSQLMGRVVHAQRRTRGAELVLQIDGIRVQGTFVPVAAEIAQAESQTWRGGWRAAQNVRISAGAPIRVRLTGPVPMHALRDAMGNSMRGGGPR